jgi:hypothetical protein
MKSGLGRLCGKWWKARRRSREVKEVKEVKDFARGAGKFELLSQLVLRFVCFPTY